MKQLPMLTDRQFFLLVGRLSVMGIEIDTHDGDIWEDTEEWGAIAYYRRRFENTYLLVKKL